jgi:hypothetical protein
MARAGEELHRYGMRAGHLRSEHRFHFILGFSPINDGWRRIERGLRRALLAALPADPLELAKKDMAELLRAGAQRVQQVHLPADPRPNGPAPLTLQRRLQQEPLRDSAAPTLSRAPAPLAPADPAPDPAARHQRHSASSAYLL